MQVVLKAIFFPLSNLYFSSNLKKSITGTSKTIANLATVFKVVKVSPFSIRPICRVSVFSICAKLMYSHGLCKLRQSQYKLLLAKLVRDPFQFPCLEIVSNLTKTVSILKQTTSKIFLNCFCRG